MHDKPSSDQCHSLFTVSSTCVLKNAASQNNQVPYTLHSRALFRERPLLDPLTVSEGNSDYLGIDVDASSVDVVNSHFTKEEATVLAEHLLGRGFDISICERIGPLAPITTSQMLRRGVPTFEPNDDSLVTLLEFDEDVLPGTMVIQMRVDCEDLTTTNADEIADAFVLYCQYRDRLAAEGVSLNRPLSDLGFTPLEN